MNEALTETFLDDIGFNLIRRWLSNNCQCTTNKTLFLKLFPSSNKHLIQTSFKKTEELVGSLDRNEKLPIKKISSESEEALTFLRAKNKRMEPIHFFEIYSLIIYSGDIKSAIKKDYFKYWAEKFSSIATFNSLRRKTLSIFDESFVLKDDASKKLKKLNQELAGFESKQISLIEVLTKKYLTNDWLESDRERIYAGRTVLSVKNKFKNKVKGIVQGYSKTNQTTFIEPLEIIEINNQIQLTKEEIRKEHIRILTSLTNFYRSFFKEIDLLILLLKDYDWFFTLSTMANQINAIVPSFSNEVRLKGFRNPIMELNNQKPIALDLKIKRSQKMIMISGPNAGGKTVTLKSVGLASAMAQCGLMIPSSSAKLKLFDSFYSDIGDNQSIENNLSTFSAHASNISIIIKNLESKNSLVLIDEIGSSTDPNMGAALSQAICEVLIKKNCFSIITTHLTKLKLWAMEKKEILSAGMEFNSKNLSPTYKLIHGEPASSHTLELGRRFGIKKSIINRASKLISSNELNLNKQLLDMKKKQQILDDQITVLNNDKNYLDKKRIEIEKKDEEINRIFTTAKNDALVEAKRVILKRRKEIEKIVMNIREDKANKESISNAKSKIKAMLQEIKDEESYDRSLIEAEVTNLKPGQKVFVPSINKHGIIESIKNTKVKLNIDSIKLTLESSKLTKPANEEMIKENNKNSEIVNLINPSESQVVVDVRGLRTEQAIEKVKKHLDSGLLNNLDLVKILHGKGTGALKNSIHNHLKSEKYVKDFEFESPDAGGEGITIVHIK